MTAQTAVIVPNPLPDLVQAERFLTLLDEEAEFFTFQTFDDLKARKDHSLARILHGDLEQHATDLQRYQWRRAGVYVTVNETDRQGRKLHNMVRPRCIFCEWDRSGQTLPQWPIEPQCIVESSPGKFHLYWFSLDLEWADFDALMQVMVVWGSDPNAKDRARVLRLPGFWHQKNDAPFQVRIIHESGALPYSREELLAAFPMTAEPPPPVEAFTVDAQSDAHWMGVVVRVVGDQAANTWAKPTHSRNAQVISLGFELAERGVPESFDETALRQFSAAMRPTDASGQVAGMNWNNEWKAIKHGRNQALTGGKPTVLHGAAVAEALIKTQERKNHDRAQTIRQTVLTARPELPVFPTELMNPPGLLGEYVAYTVATARMRQPILAIANGLALLGTVLGRTIRTETDLRANLYTLGIAPSASGKDHSRKVAKKLLTAAGLANRLGGENLASDTGLLDAMYRSPVNLFQIDEIGRILKTLTKPDKSHLYNIPTILMQLYSSADSLFLGKEYAGGERKDIEQPCACLYGTTVPMHFFNALTHEDSDDGFLGRMLIFIGNDDPQEQTPVMQPLPVTLVDAFKALAARPINVEPAGNIDQVLTPRPRIYPMSPAAVARFEDLNAWVKTHRKTHLPQGTAAIWGRAWEGAAKVALILAGCRPDDAAQITDDDAAYAIALVRWCCGCMTSSIARYVAENETESTGKRVERLIRDAGASGISFTELHTKTRFLKKRERAEVVDDLMDSGLVFQQALPAQNNNPKGARHLVHAVFSETVETVETV